MRRFLKRGAAVLSGLYSVPKLQPSNLRNHTPLTIGEAQRYIEEANRIRLAESAAEKVIIANRNWQTGKPHD